MICQVLPRTSLPETSHASRPSSSVKPTHWEVFLPVGGAEASPLLSPAPWNLSRATLWLRVGLAQTVFMVDALLAYVAGPGISEANDTLCLLYTSPSPRD